jgi:small subunit ribosomal protein S6
MNQYEAMYVIDTQLEETQRQDLIARFNALVASNGGTVDRVDEWGKRRLAYPINYKTEGYYVLMYVTARGAARELERNLQISVSCLRYIVTRFVGALPAQAEPLKHFVPRSRAEAAPAPAEPPNRACRCRRKRPLSREKLSPVAEV